MIILYIMSRFRSCHSIFPHNVVIHQSFSSEQREASRTTEYAAGHMFSRFLQPVTNRILEYLIPCHKTCHQNIKRRTINIFYVLEYCKLFTKAERALVRFYYTSSINISWFIAWPKAALYLSRSKILRLSLITWLKSGLKNKSHLEIIWLWRFVSLLPSLFFLLY